MRGWSSLICQLGIIALVGLAVTPRASGQILRWDNGQVIPGTEKDQVGPKMRIIGRQLEFADLSSQDLSDSAFTSSTFTNATFSNSLLDLSRFIRSSLMGADLSGASAENVNFSNVNFENANLRGLIATGSNFQGANFTNSDLTDAIVADADFTGATGFTAEQLYSTASYKSRQLQRIELESLDLSGWSFSGLDVTDARMDSANLTSADLSGAMLTSANFGNANLTNANLSGAILTRANFGDANLTNTDLSGAALADAYLYDANLADADLSGAALTNATLDGANFANADLTGAVISGATLGAWMGLTAEQLYSTASHRAHDLRGIKTWSVFMSGWDFSSQDLSGGFFLEWVDLSGADLSDAIVADSYFVADLGGANLSRIVATGATFYGSNLRNAILTDANVAGASLSATGLTPEQLYSTASYKARNLRKTGLGSLNLSNADFSLQDLTEAGFHGSDLTNADFSGAVLAKAKFQEAVFAGANFSDAVLSNAEFYGANMATANFTGAVFIGADLRSVNLSFADLSGAVLTDANLDNAKLAHTKLEGAIITGANLAGVRSIGPAQIYATASYKAHDLRGVLFGSLDMRGWNFRDQNLTHAGFGNANLTSADFSGAIADAWFHESNLSNANLTNAVIAGASFSRVTGLTPEQFYSTASYKTGDLRNVGLWELDLSGWDFQGQDLTDGRFGGSHLAGTNLADAVVVGVSFQGVTGLVPEQLYSTSSYKNRDLRGIVLTDNEQLRWDFAGQNLRDAFFYFGAGLPTTDLSGADLRGASVKNSMELDFSDAITANTIFPDGSVPSGLAIDPDSPWILRDDNGYSGKINPDVPDLLRDPVSITIHEHLTVTSDGTMQMVFEDSDWGSTIQFQPGIPAQLDGTLNLTFADHANRAALAGSEFQVFDWAGVERLGKFGTIATELGVIWDLNDLYAGGSITLLGISSDLNVDGDVDSGDLLDLLANWTGSEWAGDPLGWQQGDSDDDGDIDLADLLTFFQHWTGPADDPAVVAPAPGVAARSSGAAQAVPEPSSWVLVVWLVGGAIVPRTRRPRT